VHYLTAAEGALFSGAHCSLYMACCHGTPCTTYMVLLTW